MTVLWIYLAGVVLMTAASMYEQAVMDGREEEYVPHPPLLEGLLWPLIVVTLFLVGVKMSIGMAMDAIRR